MIVLRHGAWSARLRPRAIAVGLVSAGAALALSVFVLGSGDYPLSARQVLDALTGQGAIADIFIVRELRLPRVVAGLLVGAALGLGGALFQSLVRNPLGSPDMLGLTQGATTGALVALMVVNGGVALAAGAVAGGLLTGSLIYALAWRGGAHGYQLILVGIGMTAILTGINGYLITKAEITEAARAVLWATGSLNGRGWADVLPLAGVLAVLVPVVLRYGRALTMIEMGDDAAQGLGIRVERVRTMMLGAAVLIVSFAATAAGPVLFVALTAPQLARRLTRDAGPNLLPSMCVGAALLVSADLAAERLFPGRQLPVGVVTGLLGGGYLIWLLAMQRKAGRI
jgi:iron-siderophore transport system permease protein